MSTINFDTISQSTVRYYCFWFLKTKGRHIEILHPVSILTFSLSSASDSASATEFYPSWTIGDVVMMSYRCSKKAATTSQVYFRFGDVSHLRRSKTIYVSKLNKIAQSTAAILLFPISEKNGRHIEILLPVSTSTLSSSTRSSALAYQISSESAVL